MARLALQRSGHDREQRGCRAARTARVLFRRPADRRGRALSRGRQVGACLLRSVALAQAIADENRRPEDHVELIASENYASPRVMAAQGSQLTHKSAAGYPGTRYYGGSEYVDVAEKLAKHRGQERSRADH